RSQRFLHSFPTRRSSDLKNLLKTPDFYGYYTLNYNPISELTLSFSGVYTGKMKIAHVINPDTEQTALKQTPVFFENHIKAAYDLDRKSTRLNSSHVKISY